MNVEKEIKKLEKEIHKLDDKLNDVMFELMNENDDEKKEKILHEQAQKLNRIRTEKQTKLDLLKENKEWYYDPDYEIKNLPDMKRDVNSKLSVFLNDEQKKQYYQISKPYYDMTQYWIYQKLNQFPKLDYNGDNTIRRLNTYEFVTGRPFSRITINHLMFLNTGKYVLKLLIKTLGVEININNGNDPQNHFLVAQITNGDFSDYVHHLNYTINNWRINDVVEVVIDTDKKTIIYNINNQRKRSMNYPFTADLIIDLSFSRDDILHITSFLNNA